MKAKHILKNESGSILIIALLFLVLLTIIGLSGLNDTGFELRIAANQKLAERDFYVAESGWNHGLQWLDNLTTAPDRKNTAIVDPANDAYPLIRNYGDGVSGDLNDDFDTATADGVLTKHDIPYWFRVKYESNQRVPEYSPGLFREYNYLITSTADGEQFIEVRVSKIFKIGY